MVYLALSIFRDADISSNSVTHHGFPPSTQLLSAGVARLLRASSLTPDPGPALVLVKEKLTADPDSEVATTSLRVSLMCPVGMRRDRKWEEGDWVTF